VRVIAVGLLVQDGWVLGEEYAGSEASGPFLRLPGGGVEFGERADDAVRREFAEELGVTLDDAHLLGIIENIFDRPAKRGHEIVYVYGIRCAELEALPRTGACLSGTRTRRSAGIESTHWPCRCTRMWLAGSVMPVYACASRGHGSADLAV
jgi:ADP-ribose pyrophosphatase YjhB (NUDIX family)